MTFPDTTRTLGVLNAPDLGLTDHTVYIVFTLSGGASGPLFRQFNVGGVAIGANGTLTLDPLLSAGSPVVFAGAAPTATGAWDADLYIVCVAEDRAGCEYFSGQRMGGTGLWVDCTGRTAATGAFTASSAGSVWMITGNAVGVTLHEVAIHYERHTLEQMREHHITFQMKWIPMR